MKFLIASSILFFLVIGCVDKDIRPFIPGMYVRSFEQENARGTDTVIISPMPGDEDGFLLVDRTTFERIVDGEVLPRQRRQQRFSCVFDHRTRVLHELRLGHTYSFSPAEKRMYCGAVSYAKVE